jgi:hypothetical protein
MKATLLVIFCLFASLNASSLGKFLGNIVEAFTGAPKEEKCATVQPGHFWPNYPDIFNGFNSQWTLTKLIRFDPNTAKYLFPSNDDMGHLCESSWNKLFGTTRCGYLDLVHEDSDRFVWRRAQSCLIYNGNYVVGEVPNCPQADQIELAAYTYDNGNIPYKNSTLLKQFKNTVTVNVWYNYTIHIQSNQTLFVLAHANGTVIESQFVVHRDCSNQNHGNLLSFYFGGECPAPQEVTACYRDK